MSFEELEIFKTEKCELRDRLYTTDTKLKELSKELFEMEKLLNVDRSQESLFKLLNSIRVLEEKENRIKEMTEYSICDKKSSIIEEMSVLDTTFELLNMELNNL